MEIKLCLCYGDSRQEDDMLLKLMRGELKGWVGQSAKVQLSFGLFVEVVEEAHIFTIVSEKSKVWLIVLWNGKLKNLLDFSNDENARTDDFLVFDKLKVTFKVNWLI